ncbi:hypothetical protein, partial [Leyella stercorea]|uniref:hypothetical protein n=1 Tax=Leyella stercorea TaxID=363265 RepID=UPI00242E1A2E
QTSASVGADIRIGRCRHPYRSARMRKAYKLSAVKAAFVNTSTSHPSTYQHHTISPSHSI